jgi:hypothetical protein
MAFDVASPETIQENRRSYFRQTLRISLCVFALGGLLIGLLRLERSLAQARVRSASKVDIDLRLQGSKLPDVKIVHLHAILHSRFVDRSFGWSRNTGMPAPDATDYSLGFSRKHRAKSSTEDPFPDLWYRLDDALLLDDAGTITAVIKQIQKHDGIEASEMPAEVFAYIRSRILPALRSEVQRANWAQCWLLVSRASALLADAKFSVSFVHDRPELAAARNQQILLKILFDDPKNAFRDPDSVRLLANFLLGENSELDETLITTLGGSKIDDLRAWSGYLSGLKSLRAKDYEKARKYFEAAADSATHAELKDVSRFGAARSIFWLARGALERRSPASAPAAGPNLLLQEAIAQIADINTSVSARYLQEELGSYGLKLQEFVRIAAALQRNSQ